MGVGDGSTTPRLIPSFSALLHSLPSLLLLSTAALSATPAAAQGVPCGSGTVVNVRLPPSIDPSVDSNPPQWTPPPQAWLYGNWKITHTSNVEYLKLWNLEFDNTPILPTCTGGGSPESCPQGTFPGQNVDLQTWTAPNDNSGKVYSVFGYDTPHRTDYPSRGPGWNAVYDFQATGAVKGLSNSWEVLAYGYDENNDGYFVAYETEPSSQWAPAGIDIESRNPQGPSNGTYNAIMNALRGLQNAQINAIVKNMTALVQNGARDSLPPFVCGPSCVNNTGVSPT